MEYIPQWMNTPNAWSANSCRACMMGCDGTYPSVGEEWRTGAVDDIKAANIAKRKSRLIMVSNKGNSVTDVKVKDFSDY